MLHIGLDIINLAKCKSSTLIYKFSFGLPGRTEQHSPTSPSPARCTQTKMTSTIKTILILSLLAYTKSTFGQTEYATFINNRVESLTKSGVDTVITLSNNYPFSSYLKEDTIKGLGNINILAFTLLLYRDKSVWKAEKYLSYFKDNSATTIAKSKALELKTDSNFSKLWLFLPKIQKQSFRPYIYKDSSNGIASYDLGYMTHAPSYDLRVQTKKYYQAYAIEEIALHEKYLDINDGPTNLNYKYNTSLELFSFFTTLRQLSLILDSKFEY